MSFRNDPEKAKEYASSLDMPYLKKELFKESDYILLVSGLTEGVRLKSFEILFVAPISKNLFLVLTKIIFEDFGLGANGNSTEIAAENYHDFVLCFDPVKIQLTIQSDLYSNVTEKLQKEEFSRQISAIVTGNNSQ